MSKWQRSEVGDSIKVTFQVKRAEHAELFDWLCSLPYRKASECIRDILSGALERVAANRGGDPERRAGTPVAPRPSQPAGEGAPITAYAAEPREEQLTLEVANLLREMDKAFS